MECHENFNRFEPRGDKVKWVVITEENDIKETRRKNRKHSAHIISRTKVQMINFTLLKIQRKGGSKGD